MSDWTQQGFEFGGQKKPAPAKQRKDKPEQLSRPKYFDVLECGCVVNIFTNMIIERCEEHNGSK